jgi:hypothetical protein
VAVNSEPGLARVGASNGSVAGEVFIPVVLVRNESYATLVEPLARGARLLAAFAFARDACAPPDGSPDGAARRAAAGRPAGRPAGRRWPAGWAWPPTQRGCRRACGPRHPRAAPCRPPPGRRLTPTPLPRRLALAALDAQEAAAGDDVPPEAWAPVAAAPRGSPGCRPPAGTRLRGGTRGAHRPVGEQYATKRNINHYDCSRPSRGLAIMQPIVLWGSP